MQMHTSYDCEYSGICISGSVRWVCPHLVFPEYGISLILSVYFLTTETVNTGFHWNLGCYVQLKMLKQERINFRTKQFLLFGFIHF